MVTLNVAKNIYDINTVKAETVIGFCLFFGRVLTPCHSPGYVSFGCEGQSNNLPIIEGNTTGKFNTIIRHYGPSKMVSNGEEGYDPTMLIKRVK